MKRSWDLKPNLLECMLEQRIVPAYSNLGVVILTTSGLSLVTPFPGASTLGSGQSSSSNTASSVSGAALPTTIYMTGNRGISGFTIGNFTGNPSLGGGGPAGSSGGVSLSIQVGSGADTPGGPVSTTAASSRTNPSYDGSRPSYMTYLSSVGSGSAAPTAADAQATTSAAAPVPSLPRLGTAIPGSPTGTGSSPAPTNPNGPQLGAPRLVRGLGTTLMPSLPGGLGVGTSQNAPASSGY